VNIGRRAEICGPTIDLAERNGSPGAGDVAAERMGCRRLTFEEDAETAWWFQPMAWRSYKQNRRLGDQFVGWW
jgi:hypothetical protein